MKAKYYTLKVANMKKEQSFILYPYDGGDYIYLQSPKRFARVNLRSGIGLIDGKNRNYSNSVTLAMCPLPFKLSEEMKTEIQGYLWNNSGVQEVVESVLFIENKELFSEPKNATA